MAAKRMIIRVKRKSQLGRIKPKAGKIKTDRIATLAEITLAREIILPRQRVVTKTNIRQTKKAGEKPRTAPALVATALPPLNPAKIGKVWPITAKRPKISGEIPSICRKSGSNVASVPLKKSMAKVAVPAVLPKIRKVLVVPVLPLPYSRRFFLKKICPIQSPVGMEPNKYASNNPIIVFIMILLYHDLELAQRTMIRIFLQNCLV